MSSSLTTSVRFGAIHRFEWPLQELALTGAETPAENTILVIRLKWCYQPSHKLPSACASSSPARAAGKAACDTPLKLGLAHDGTVHHALVWSRVSESQQGSVVWEG